MIRGCGTYNFQTAIEWTRKKPTTYVFNHGKVVVARPRKDITTLYERDIYPDVEQVTVANNLVLVSPEIKYAESLFLIINENRDKFSQVMAWPQYVKTPADTVQFLIESKMSHQKGYNKTYIIIYKNDPVGILSFNSIDSPNKIAYIGYWLDLKMQGNGIVSQSLAVLIKYYASLNLIQRFVIKCITTNKASNNVALHCGFNHEGILRSAEKINGVFHD